MARKAAAPSQAPKPHPLDWSHKLIFPALSLIVAIGFGLYGIYNQRENERLNGAMKQLNGELEQHTKAEQAAKDQAQWLRVEMSKFVQRQNTKLKTVGEQIGADIKDNPRLRASVAVFLALSMVSSVDNITNEEAAKFGDEVKELWKKAVMRATEEVQKELPPWKV